MSVIKSLIKIDITDRQDVYLICSYDEHKKHLRIIILDQNEGKTFIGHATDVDLRLQAATIRMVFTDFLSLTLKALTKSKPDDDKFLYSIEKNCEGFVFKWKSVDQDETIINIGSLRVIENDYKSTIKDALCLLSEEMTNLREKLASMSENFCDLKKEIENSMRLLTDMNDMKERIENELYSKFILILNEKKKKIRDLKRKTRDTSPGIVNKNQTNSVKLRKVHQISDSSDEDDPEIMNVAGPSTSKCNRSLLFFDDDEPQMVISPSKKRNRAQCNVSKKHEYEAKKSNAKPVISESEDEDELFKYL